MTLPGIARSWVRERRAVVLPDELSRGFDRYLLSLPWAGSALDWSKMPAPQSFDLRCVDSAEFQEWLRKTRIGVHSSVAVWYSAERGGIVAPLLMALECLDELYWGAPGVRYAFGVDVEGSRMEPAYGDLVQYGAGDLLVAVGS